MLPIKRQREVPNILAQTVYNGPSTLKNNVHNLQSKLLKKKIRTPIEDDNEDNDNEVEGKSL